MSNKQKWKARPDEPGYAEKRAAIIAGATKIITKHGIAGLRLEAILQEAGIKKSTYYRFFSSKEELLLAVLESEFYSVARTITNKVTDISDPIDQIIEGVYQTIRAHRTNTRLKNLLGPESPCCIRLNTLAQDIYPAMAAPMIGEVLSLQPAKNNNPESAFNIARWILNIVLSMSIFGSGKLNSKEEKQLLQRMLRPTLESF